MAWQPTLEALYLIGLSLFGLYFIWSLGSILYKIRKHPKTREASHTKVLLQKPEPPHTFLRYLFIEKTAFNNQKIPQAVLHHELAHIEQRHSFDLLLAEGIRLLFWFHPLVWAYCRAIRLNHEFLADRSVISKGFPAREYQHALLAFSNRHYQPAFTHAFHYSSIKKRIQVMKTNTTTRRSKLGILMLAPILTFTLLSFSGEKTIVRTLSPDPALQEPWSGIRPEIQVSEASAYRNPEVLESRSLQTSASREEMKTYNALARKYTAMIDKGRIEIHSREIDQMKAIYAKMSE